MSSSQWPGGWNLFINTMRHVFVLWLTYSLGLTPVCRTSTVFGVCVPKHCQGHSHAFLCLFMATILTPISARAVSSLCMTLLNRCIWFTRMLVNTLSGASLQRISWGQWKRLFSHICSVVSESGGMPTSFFEQICEIFKIQKFKPISNLVSLYMGSTYMFSTHVCLYKLSGACMLEVSWLSGDASLLVTIIGYVRVNRWCAFV